MTNKFIACFIYLFLLLFAACEQNGNVRRGNQQLRAASDSSRNSNVQVVSDSVKTFRDFWAQQFDTLNLKRTPAQRIHICDSLIQHSSIAFKNDSFLVGWAKLVLGRAYRQSSQFDSALTNYDQGIAILSAAHLHSRAAKGYYEKAILYFNNFKSDSGFAIARRGVHEALSGGNPDSLVLLNIYSYVTSEYSNLRNFDSAIFYARRGEELLKRPQAFNPGVLQAAYTNIGTVYEYTGQFDKAMYFRIKAVKYCEEYGDQYQLFINKLNLALLYQETGNYRMGIPILKNYYAQFIPNFNEDVGDEKASVARDLSDISSVLAKCFDGLKREDSAVIYFHKSIVFGKIAYPTRSYEMRDLYSDYSAFNSHSIQNWDSVLVYQKFALDACEDAEQRNWYTRYYYTEQCAHAYAASGKITMALNLADESIKRLKADDDNFDWEKEQDPLTTMQAMDVVSSAYEALYDHTHEPEYARDALELADKIRAGEDYLIPRNDNQNAVAILNSKENRNERVIGLLWKLYSSGDTTVMEKVLSAFEDHKSTLLKKYFQLRVEAGENSDSLFSQISSLKVQRKLLSDEIAKSTNTSGSLNIRFNEISFKLDSLIEELNRSILLHGKNSKSGINLSNFRQRLADNEMILDFVKTIDAVYILSIEKSEARFEKIDWNEERQNVLTEFITSESKTTLDDSSLNALSSILIPSIFMSAPLPKSLILIPDKDLNLLSFECLRDIDGKGGSKYLGDLSVIRYEYCLSFLLSDSTIVRKPGKILAIAPSFRQSTAQTSSSNSQTSPDNSQAYSSQNLFDSNPVLRSGFGPLKYNGEEVKEILNRYGGTELSGEVTEMNFRELAPQFNILHFATHAYSNPDNPDLSGIILQQSRDISDQGAAPSATDSLLTYDNILHAYEIQNLKLNADMVVLSACQTGIGTYQVGEGAMSLARAFKYANCPNTVTSLWKVDDASTKEIMTSFYDNLGQGLGKADALAEAKRSFRNNHPNASAFYWAPFILIGDNEPMQLEKKSGSIWWLIISGVLMSIAIIFLLIKRRFKASLSKE